jgi:hypothetical protein
LDETATGIRDGLVAVRCARTSGEFVLDTVLIHFAANVLPFLAQRGTRARLVFPRQANCAVQYSRVANFVLQVALPETLLTQVKPSVCAQNGRHLGTLRATCSH